MMMLISRWSIDYVIVYRVSPNDYSISANDYGVPWGGHIRNIVSVDLTKMSTFFIVYVKLVESGFG